MPRVTQEHLDARRREILAAAHRCFARRGFHDATMQEIADEAGLSAGALYRYFDGKQALVEALAAWGRAQKRRALEAVEPDSGVEGLGRLVTRMLETLQASERSDEAVRLDVRLWGEALGDRSLQPLVADALETFRQPLADHLRGEQEVGRVRADVDPEMVARALLSLLSGLELQLAFDPELKPEAYAGAVTSLLDGLEA